MLGQRLGLSRAHTRREGHSTSVQSTESTYLKVLIYIMVAYLYMLQNTEGNKSFLCHKQLNYDTLEYNSANYLYTPFGLVQRPFAAQ